MREYLGSGNMKFVLDIKQAVRANESPFDMCDAMGSDIINVHISDNDIQRDCMLPGMGTMDFKKLTCKLDEYGYFGPLIIEVYRANFKNFSEIEEAKYYIDSVFSDKFRNI